MIKCAYFPQCTGCSGWDTPYSVQKTNKILHLRNLLQENNQQATEKPAFIECGEQGLRHRVDFTIKYDIDSMSHIFGFYDQNKKLIHIEDCLQLAPELRKVYAEFRQFNFAYNKIPVRKGSIRLRVGPTGLKGCWLDFSNIEIKHLLEDQKVLNEMLDAGFIIEIGQKGKKLIRTNSELKLSEPEPNYWFKTLNEANLPLNLKCLISDFTQPSWSSADNLVRQVMTWTSEMGEIKSVLEFGSGIGQFTISFLKAGYKVAAIEVSESAVMSLTANAEIHEVSQKLSVHLGDFHRKILLSTENHDLIFVNPARSGLKNFTSEILKQDAQFLIYVSCFPETMVSDLEHLSTKYKLCNIMIVDQFPQTKHFEVCALLKNYTKE